MRKKLLAAIISFAFIAAALCITPAAAAADEGAPDADLTLTTSNAAVPKGHIYVGDEFGVGAWSLNSYPADFCLYDNGNMDEGVNPYAGKIVFDAATCTLSLNDASFGNLRAVFLTIGNMDNITISVNGTNTICMIHAINTNVTITGTGTLNLNPAFDLSKFDGYGSNVQVWDTAISMENSCLRFGKDVTINFLNGNTDETISLSFDEETPLATAFGYENTASETPKWTSGHDTAVVIERDETDTVYHRFPAGKLYKLEGQEGANYWIPTEEYQQTIYRPLVLVDSMWFEEYGVAYIDKSGSWYLRNYAIDPYTNLVSYNPADDVALEKAPTFTPYADFSEMPASLVQDDIATACVKIAGGVSGQVYEKDGGKYKLLLHLRGVGGYCNAALDPIEPDALGERKYYSYDFLKINAVGDRTYLTYVDTNPLLESDDWDAVGENQAKAAAEALGYKRVEKETSIGFYHVLKNGKITFAPDNEAVDIAKCTITGIKDKEYTGKAITQSITVKYGKTKLTANKNYKVTYKSNKEIGTATATITGLGKYTGTVTKKFKVTRATNSATKVTSSKKIAYSKLKKSNQSFTIAATVKEKAAKTFALTSVPKAAKKYISVSKAGKVTVKKGLKKGTYKIQVKITAAQTKHYKKTTVTKTIAITVK